ncbi:hypothetical protein [Enterobacter kobei]|uniref:hypothetical protein n=1 Tax=Enterobacter kobei TaxID=208224 RepID=UPI0021BE0094|nr:hypothetical protein [Enterobacter kobei]UXJ66708.1 hypothetical protein N5P26_22830 [Enterobacter kobei]
MHKKGQTLTIKQWRPDPEETANMWKLFSAASRVQDRWSTNTVPQIAEELASTTLSREEKQFLLRAWQMLVDDKAGFGRFMGAFDCYVHNVQDPAAEYVAYKPELKACIEDGLIFDVLLEAYQHAQQRIQELEALTFTVNLPDDLDFDCEYEKGGYSPADEPFLRGRVEGWNLALGKVSRLNGVTGQQPTAWFTDDHKTDKSATTYDSSVALRWKSKGWPITPLYNNPPAQIQPAFSDDYLDEQRAAIIESVATKRWGVGYVFNELLTIANKIRHGVAF